MSQNEVENSFSVSTIALVVYGFFGIVFLLLACFLFILGLTPTLPCCRYSEGLQFRYQYFLIAACVGLKYFQERPHYNYEIFDTDF